MVIGLRENITQVDQSFTRLLTFHAVTLSEPPKRLFDIQSTPSHLLFIRERREEQGDRCAMHCTQRNIGVRHVRRSRRERTERLRVREQFGIGYRCYRSCTPEYPDEVNVENIYLPSFAFRIPSILSSPSLTTVSSSLFPCSIRSTIQRHLASSTPMSAMSSSIRFCRL